MKEENDGGGRDGVVIVETVEAEGVVVVVVVEGVAYTWGGEACW